MKVIELNEHYTGRRLRVSAVAPSEAERLGYVNDTERLTGQEGILTSVHMSGEQCLQAQVAWDEEGPGTLSLSHGDEVEFLVSSNVATNPTEGNTDGA